MHSGIGSRPIALSKLLFKIHCAITIRIDGAKEVLDVRPQGPPVLQNMTGRWEISKLNGFMAGKWSN